MEVFWNVCLLITLPKSPFKNKLSHALEVYKPSVILFTRQIKQVRKFILFGMYFLKLLIITNIKPILNCSFYVSIYLFCPTNLFYINIKKSIAYFLFWCGFFLNLKSIWVSFTREFDKGKGERMCLHLSFHKRSPLDGSLNSGVRKNSRGCFIIDAWIMNPTVLHIFVIWSKIRIETYMMTKNILLKEKRTLQLYTKLIYFCMEGKGTPSLHTKSFRTFCS